MPRTVQKQEPSHKEKALKDAATSKLAKEITKKKRVGASDIEKKLSIEEKRLKRKMNLLNRFKTMAEKYEISKISPTVRCIKKAICSVHSGTSTDEFGNNIRISAQAVRNIISYADSVVNEILKESKTYIPKKQVTLKKEYVEKVLSRHKYRELLRLIDGRVFK